MPAACSSDGHLMNVLERSQACECSTSECDGLTCGSVVSTTAQDLSVTDSHTVEQEPAAVHKHRHRATHVTFTM